MGMMEELEREVDAIRDLVAALRDEARRHYYAEAKRRLKDPDTYAAMNYVLVAGLHHLYLGLYGRAILEFVLLVVGVILLFTPLWPPGILLIMTLSFVELWNLFHSQSIVAEYNNRVSREILGEVRLQHPVR